MSDQIIPEVASQGKVEIQDDVIRTIAGLAASKVEGVYSMKGGFLKGVKQAVTGISDYSGGVEVKRDLNNGFTLDLYVVIDFGVKINDVAAAVQGAVKEQVESITGREVNAVNVIIADIKLPEELLKPQ